MEIGNLENDLENVNNSMEIHSSNPEELNELFIKKEILEGKLEELFTTWAEIMEE